MESVTAPLLQISGVRHRSPHLNSMGSLCCRRRGQQELGETIPRTPYGSQQEELGEPRPRTPYDKCLHDELNPDGSIRRRQNYTYSSDAFVADDEELLVFDERVADSETMFI